MPQLVWHGELVVTSKTKGTSPLFHLRAFTDSHDKSLYDSTPTAFRPSRLWMMARPAWLPCPCSALA